MSPQRFRWLNPPGYRGRLRTHGLFVGTRQEDGAPVYLHLDLLSTHTDVTGSTGAGKTRMLLSMADQLARIPNATLVVVNPKGSFGVQLRDQFIANGLTKRLVWFCPGDDMVAGWNPLAPNALSVATHAKAAREAIRASWGQVDFDQTAQLARYLYLSLVVARDRGLTLPDAISILEPRSPLRSRVLPEISDPYVREALERLSDKPDARQEELIGSTVARLEAFVLDPMIRAVVARRDDSLSLADVIRENKILIFDTPVYAPLRADDVKLLGRLFVNDLLGHVFARPPAHRTPVYLMIDELQMVATDDLAVALEAGRELGLHAILSHQHLNQLREESSHRLYDAVMNCARTKLVFGGLSAEQLDPMVRELTIDQFDPMAVKDEIRANEIIPVETTRNVITRTWGTGRVQGEAQALGTGESTSTSKAATHTWGRSEHRGEFESEGIVVGSHMGMSSGQVLSPDGELLSASDTAASGLSTATISGRGRMKAVGHHAAESVQAGESLSRSVTKQATQSHSASENEGVSHAVVPFHEYLVRERVTSRTFWTEGEFLTERLKEIKELAAGYFFLKVSGKPALVLRAPYVDTPFVSARRRQDALNQVYRQRFYRSRAQIDLDEKLVLAESPQEPQVIDQRGRGARRTRRRRQLREAGETET